MATINASTLLETQYSGDKGAVHAHGNITLSGAQVGDKVRLLRLYAGTKLFGVKMINAALGAGSTISIGYENVDGTAGGGAAVLLAATSTAALGKTESGIAPMLVAGDFYVTATVGGGLVTGQLDVVILFEHRGTL